MTLAIIFIVVVIVLNIITAFLKNEDARFALHILKSLFLVVSIFTISFGDIRVKASEYNKQIEVRETRFNGAVVARDTVYIFRTK
jgi:uncharacterized membrane protein